VRNQKNPTEIFLDSTLNFVLSELEISETFADIALNSDAGEKISRNRQNARKGYETALRFMAAIPADDRHKLHEKLDSLKSKLVELGEDV